MSLPRPFLRAVAATLLALFSVQVLAQDVTIVINRIAADRYEIVKARDVKPGEVILQTKYCHAYARNEEALFLTREEQNGEVAMIYFASGDQCEVIKVDKTSDANFSLIQFLIELGLLIGSKGAITPTAKPKR